MSWKRPRALATFSRRSSYEDDTSWRAHLKGLPRGSQTARARINPENNDAVRVLVGCQQPTPGRIESKMPRGFATRGLILQGLKPARPGIHGEYSDAVVAAIRGID